MTGDMKTTIDPSGIGEIVKHGGCPRYAKLRYEGDDEETDRNWKEAFQPLSPLLSSEGTEFEEEVYESFRTEAKRTIESWRDYENQVENDRQILDAVRDVADTPKDNEPVMLMQAHFADEIGEFFVAGDADLVVLWPEEEGTVRARIFDIKASWDEKPYHWVQTATYGILLRSLLDQSEFDVSVSIETGIITRETDLSSITPGGLPEFDKEPVEGDVHALLSEEGVVYNVLGQDANSVPHQFDSACHNCPFNESCFTQAIEEKDIRLLGLTRGEQKVLREHGFETVEDIAEIIEPLEDPRPYEFDFPEVREKYRSQVQSLSEEHGIGERLPLLSQKAQGLLGELNSDHPAAHDKPWPQWIVGSGSGSLPEDDPPYDADLPIERGSLIRVYLNVQWDHIRDSPALLSGRVDCENYDGTPLSFSSCIDDIPETEEENATKEGQLLEEFLDDLFEAIRIVARLTGQPERAAIHLYFYTNQERDNLMEAVKRHSGAERVNAMRDLLGLRPGIDQSMVSIVRDEVESRISSKYLSTGLLPMVDQLSPYDEDDQIEFSDWTYERDDGTTVNLRHAFWHKVFDYSVHYEEQKDSIKLLLDNSKESDGRYPSRGRFDSQIPLEYIWAADGIDEFDASWTDDPQYKGIIELFQWVDTDKKNTRIAREDLQALGKRFCWSLQHVERGLTYRNPDIEKESLPLDNLDGFNLGSSSLARSCKEYLDLEYSTAKQEALDHYQKPVKQRILTGKSIPVRIEQAEVEDGLLHAHGRLIYDEFDFASPEHVAHSCRKSGSDGSSGGSRMLASGLQPTGDGFVDSVDRPDQILHSTPVTVESLDADGMNITIRAFPNGGSKDDEYREYHNHYTTDESDAGRFTTYFGAGEEFILDPASDDLTAQRAHTALERTDSNALYQVLDDLTTGQKLSTVENRFDQGSVEEFCDWLVENYDPSPNSEQQAFITNVGDKFSLLQGPPGTGKTSGAIALAILARVYDFGTKEKPRPLRGLVTGASNKAIDETMEDVVNALVEYRQNGDKNVFDDLKVVRLTGEKPDDPLPMVDYVNYHTDEAELDATLNRIKHFGHRERQSSLTEHSTDQAVPHVLVFATPSRTFGLAGKFAEKQGDDDAGAEEAYNIGLNMFDVYAADEASMLPLPQLFMGGAFLDEEAGWQALIAGDQRQMPPVQSHDWLNEDRRTIVEVAPFLSTLDYLRFLRGDTVESLEEFDDLQSPEVDIPITRLQETYRCHTDVADFLRRWVYEKDGIEYSSSQTHTIGSIDNSVSEGVKAALDPNSPITLVLHDDERSRQSNPVEATLARDIINAVPENESVGVVTPHNSQKGLLNSVCSRGQIDTVERFQGGERDVMVVSATVSDPDALDDESEFILNPNRMNVALSRMKKKLVVLAPWTLFEMIPNDVDEYEDAAIWKGLYAEVSPEDGAKWDGALSEFVDGDVISGDAGVGVYAKDE